MSPTMLKSWFARGPLRCATPESAAVWFDREVARLTHSGRDRAETEDAVRRALGLASGFYSIDVARRVYTFWGATHPVFGTPDERAAYDTNELAQIAQAVYKIVHEHDIPRA